MNTTDLHLAPASSPLADPEAPAEAPPKRKASLSRDDLVVVASCVVVVATMAFGLAKIFGLLG